MNAAPDSNGQIGSTFRHALIYSLAGILGKAIGFIMLPVYAHYLRGEGYGIIGMIDVVISVVAILIGYGLQGAMTRLYYERETREDRYRLVSTAVMLMAMAVILLGIPMILLGRPIAWLAFGQPDLSGYIILAVLTFMADMTAKNAETFILIRQKSILFAVLSLCRLVLAFSLNIYFIVYLKLGVTGYLYSGLITAVIFSVFMHFYCLRLVGMGFDRQGAVAILAYSLPLIPGYIAMFIRNNVNRILLRIFMNLTQLGAFEMLFKFATLIGLFIVEPFSKIWGVKRFEIAEQEGAPETMARVYTMVLGIMLFFGLVLSVEIPVLLRLLAPEEFWLPGYVAGLAVLSRIILASYYHFYFGLLYVKRTGVISCIQIATTVLNLGVSLALIQPFGIAGAVWSSCLASVFQCAAALVLAQKYYRIPFQWAKVILMMLGATLLFLGVDAISPGDKPILNQWLVKYVTPWLQQVIYMTGLDRIENGQLLIWVSSRIGLMADGVIKLMLSAIFLLVLLWGGVIPLDRIIVSFRKRSAKALFRHTGNEGTS